MGVKTICDIMCGITGGVEKKGKDGFYRDALRGGFFGAAAANQPHIPPSFTLSPQADGEKQFFGAEYVKGS